MLFSSIVFLFTFLPVTLLVYHLVPGRMKNIVLLLCSLVFYAWGEPVYVILMILSILFNYVSGIDIERNLENPFKAKQSVVIAVGVNLLILGFFKYYGFLIESLNAVLPVELPYKELALPVGISFYTFQTLSYIIDVYRGKVQVQRNLVSFGVYVTMFPQLIAGPIVKYKAVAEDLDYRKHTIENFALGTRRFTVGLAKKVLLANAIGRLWEQSLAAQQVGTLTVFGSWLGLLAFGFQIYFDFSSYSDMAIGLGQIFGFRFNENFDYPYLSCSVSEFWRRWHMSLTSWFREYLYIPLGGNRGGTAKTLRNIVIVWFCTGFWHGASWNFVLWGLYFAAWLILEKYVLHDLLENTPRWMRRIYTLLAVFVGWGIFAIEDITKCGQYLAICFGQSVVWSAADAYTLRSYAVILVILIIASTTVGKQTWQRLPERAQKVATPILMLAGLFLCTAYLVDSSYNPFLYFRF